MLVQHAIQPACLVLVPVDAILYVLWCVLPASELADKNYLIMLIALTLVKWLAWPCIGPAQS